MSESITQFSKKIADEFSSVEENYHEFLTPNNPYSNKLKTDIKLMYDFLKNDKNLPQGNGLPELIIENFGHEEIWSQLELENDSLYFRFITDISKVLSTPIVDKEETEFSADELSSNEDVSEQELQLEGSDNSKSNDEDEVNNIDATEEKSDKYESDDEQINDENEVNDKFFNLKEMENFLNEEDRKAMKSSSKKKVDDDSDESSVDYFAESDDEEDANDLRYKNFFDIPNTSKDGLLKDTNDKKSSDDESGSDSGLDNQMDEPEDNLKKQEPSSFELRQERLKKKIGHLENAAIEEKSWQLKGEITADTRPQNSLLEEILDFDVTARPDIIVTEQTNMQLEDIIKQRIKDKAWDSVQRKVKPVDEPLEFKKKLALDSEKSKESLAQIYEKEYIKQREALDPENNDKSNEISPEEIKTTALINNLFSKLDALSHFYFTPRLVKPEAKIVSNLPAISMEEVAPVSVSDAALLAPEEVRAKQKGDPMAREERTATDRKRERRIKKIKQHKRKLDAEAKTREEPKTKKQAKLVTNQLLKQVTKDRNISVMKSSKTDIVGKSSEKFFSQLQDSVKSHINSKITNNKNKQDKNKNSAKKFKL